MNTLNRCIARVLIVCIFGMGMPMSSMAGIVTTDQVYAGVERNQIQRFLARDDVRAQLQAFGVDPVAARARVDALNDGEVTALVDQMGQLPAGGHDFLGVALFVFVLLLITDILGFTKIFPFTKPVR